MTFDDWFVTIFGLAFAFVYIILGVVAFVRPDCSLGIGLLCFLGAALIAYDIGGQFINKYKALKSNEVHGG
jgi:hypothetical protein